MSLHGGVSYCVLYCVQYGSRIQRRQGSGVSCEKDRAPPPGRMIVGESKSRRGGGWQVSRPQHTFAVTPPSGTQGQMKQIKRENAAHGLEHVQALSGFTRFAGLWGSPSGQSEGLNVRMGSQHRRELYLVGRHRP